MNTKKSFLIKDWDKFVKEGRGDGRCETYRPAFTVREVCSRTQRERVFIGRFGRTFENMSHGETLTLLQLDWNDDVAEVREQFPLDPDITAKIADELHLCHPGYTRGGTIMTTDFLVTWKKPDGSVFKKAFQVKSSERDLENGRTRAKLQIESEYWKRKGIPWCVLLSKSYNRIFCSNLEILHPYRETRFTDRDLKFMLDILKREIACNSFMQYSSASGELEPLPDKGISLSVTDGLKILLSRKLLVFPDHSKLLTDCHLRDFRENSHVSC